MEINLPNNVSKLLDALEEHGHEAYVVGGCVRDSYLNKEPHDWDITTSATPNEMKSVLKHKSIDTGLQHGTVTFIVDKEPYEITTFRKDGEYSDGRRPDKVTFTNSIEEDLSRRDFTINSMAYSPKRGLIDPFNGVEDLKKRKIRTVGDPNKRFQEDGLRIMRGIRFASTYQFEIDSNTSGAMHNNLNCLDNISKERVKSELFKIFSSENNQYTAALFSDYRDVMFKAVPQLETLDNFDQKNKYHDKNLFDHTIKVMAEVPNNPELKMAALLHDIGKPATAKLGDDGYLHYKGHPKVSKDIAREVCQYLKMSNEETDNVTFMVEEHDNRPAPTIKSIRRFIARCNSDYLAENSLKLMESDIKAHTQESIENMLSDFELAKEIYFEERKKQNSFKLKDLAINGSDLLKQGFPQGKEIGERLNNLFQMVIDGDIDNDRNLLMNYNDPKLIFVKEHYRKGKIVKAHFRKSRK